MRAALACALLLGSGVARAQLLDESFESGGLDGGWTVYSSISGMPIGVTAGAAHRGLYGFELQDMELVTKGTAGNYASRPLPALAPAFYSRMWVRITGWNGMGDGISWYTLFVPNSPMPGSIDSFATDGFDNLFFIIQPVDAQGTGYVSQTTTTLLGDGGWHLVESAAFGLGTDAGTSFLYMDGIQVATLSGLWNVPTQLPSVDIGEVYANNGGSGNFEGTLSLDDLRVDSAPLPGSLGLAGPATIRAGACVALDVSLTSNAPWPDGGPATSLAAPYAVSVDVSGVSAFSDGLCTQASQTVTLPQSATSATLHAVFPDAGTYVLTAAQQAPADFLPGSLTVNVQPAPDAGIADAGAPGADAGSADGATPDAGSGEDGGLTPASYYACGCGAANPAAAALLAALLSAAGSRRRSRARPRSSPPAW